MTGDRTRPTRTPADPPWPDVHDGWEVRGSGPQAAFPVPFTPFDGLGLLAWGIVAPVVIGLAVAAAGGGLTDTGALLSLLVLQLVTLAGALGILRFAGSLSWRLLGPVRPAPRHAGLGLLGGIAGFALVNAALAGFSALTGYEPETTQSLLDQVRTGGPLEVVLVVVAACVLAPVLEEVVHRGVLFQSLRRRAGLAPAIVLSSAAFALVHLELATEPVLLLGLAAFGAWLALLLHRTGSLVTAIIAHATYNALTLVVALRLLPSG